jgi:hypothetical protein
MKRTTTAPRRRQWRGLQSCGIDDLMKDETTELAGRQSLTREHRVDPFGTNIAAVERRFPSL